MKTHTMTTNEIPHKQAETGRNQDTGTKEGRLNAMDVPEDTKVAVRLWWASITLAEAEEEIRQLCRVDGHPILQEPDAIDALTGHEAKAVFRALRAIAQRLERAAPSLADSIASS